MTDIKKNYTELMKLNTFEERLEYLRLDNGKVGIDTFGFDRYLNQDFYKSKEWKRVRNQVIVRDKCCDLGIQGRDIYTKVYIHHMNPITPNDIKYATDLLLNPEYLICVTHETHNAIHYGTKENEIDCFYAEREKNDTSPWRNK